MSTRTDKELAADMVVAMIEKGFITYNGDATAENMAKGVAKAFEVLYSAVRGNGSASASSAPLRV